MFHGIQSVTPLPEMRLSVQFLEGVTKIYDASMPPERILAFRCFEDHPEFFFNVEVDVGGHGAIWGNSPDLSCDKLWKNGQAVQTPFDGLIALSDATTMWELSESTLRKAIAYGKLVNGVDVRKYGKQWVASTDSIIREYGEPKSDAVFKGRYTPQCPSQQASKWLHMCNA